MKPRVSIIAAIGRNREIGKGNQLLWHISDDLKRFKQITLGHPVLMGRKTFESILSVLGKPLPGRQNVVITRDPSWKYEGVIVARSIEEALERAGALDQDEIFIGGGGEIWKQSLPYVDKLYLTLIEDEREGDVFFPEYEHTFTKKTFEEKRVSPYSLSSTARAAKSVRLSSVPAGSSMST